MCRISPRLFSSSSFSGHPPPSLSFVLKYFKPSAGHFSRLYSKSFSLYFCFRFSSFPYFYNFSVSNQLLPCMNWFLPVSYIPCSLKKVSVLYLPCFISWLSPIFDSEFVVHLLLANMHKLAFCVSCLSLACHSGEAISTVS